MSDPIVELIENVRSDMRKRDREVDAQLAKIHDLVNSQLTEAINRFRDALATIEELKAMLAEKSASRGVLDPTPPPAPDTPTTEELLMAQLAEFIDATKDMALKVLDQTEKVSSLILQRRARADTEQTIERRRVYP